MVKLCSIITITQIDIRMIWQRCFAREFKRTEIMQIIEPVLDNSATFSKSPTRSITCSWTCTWMVQTKLKWWACSSVNKWESVDWMISTQSSPTFALSHTITSIVISLIDVRISTMPSRWARPDPVYPGCALISTTQIVSVCHHSAIYIQTWEIWLSLTLRCARPDRNNQESICVLNSNRLLSSPPLSQIEHGEESVRAKEGEVSHRAILDKEERLQMVQPDSYKVQVTMRQEVTYILLIDEHSRFSLTFR